MTVTCYDEVLGYSFDARANDFERYPFEKKSGRANLTNFREFKTADYIFQATVGSKKAISFANKNAVLKGQKYDDSITLVDGLGMKVTDDFNREMIRLGQVGPGEYGMSMYNKAGAKTIWQDAETGDARFTGSGEFSGRIVASFGLIGGWTINAGSLSGAGQINGGNINGTTMFASTIQGGSIYGSYIATSAAFPRSEMSNSSNLFRASRSAGNYVELNTGGTLTSPELFFTNGVAQGRLIQWPGTMELSSSVGIELDGSRVDINATGSIYLWPSSGLIMFPGFYRLYGQNNGKSVGQAIDELWAAINAL